MIEAVVTPTVPYRLRLMCRSGTWNAPLADGSTASGSQRSDGRVVVRAMTETGVAHARFMLALDDDTAGSTPGSIATRCSVHRRAAGRLPAAPARDGDPRGLAGDVRAADRGPTSRDHRARTAPARPAVATREGLADLPADLRADGLAISRATTLVRLARSLDLERLHGHDTAVSYSGSAGTWHRALVGRRDRTRGARPLRPRSSGRPRARSSSSSHSRAAGSRRPRPPRCCRGTGSGRGSRARC